MALSRKPKQDKKLTQPISVEEDKVAELILKGGSSPNENPVAEVEEVIKLVQLRIPVSQLKEIDTLVKKRAGKLSRHTWIMEAIVKKIEEDK